MFVTVEHAIPTSSMELQSIMVAGEYIRRAAVPDHKATAKNDHF